jgi:hypothetical protein
MFKIKRIYSSVLLLKDAKLVTEVHFLHVLSHGKATAHMARDAVPLNSRVYPEGRPWDQNKNLFGILSKCTALQAYWHMAILCQRGFPPFLR